MFEVSSLKICVSLSDSVCHDPLFLSLVIISGCLFAGLDIMMTVHHSEYLRGDMTTSLPLPLPPYLPLLLPPHPPPHRPLHPLRPAVLHQVSVRYHPSSKLNDKHRFIESFHILSTDHYLRSGYSYCKQDPQRCSLRNKKKPVRA